MSKMPQWSRTPIGDAAKYLKNVPLFLFTLLGGWLVRRIFTVLRLDDLIDAETIKRISVERYIERYETAIATHKKQGLRRRVGFLQHLPVGMEGREVQRNLRAELVNEPAREPFQLARRVVLVGDQQGGDLEPDIGLLLDVDQGVEHIGQVAAAELPVEVLGEGLEVDVHRVHVAVNSSRGSGQM